MTGVLPISRFPVPDLANMPEDIRNRILAVQEKSGFIPNVFLVLAHRPEEFRAFFAYHDALMERAGNLTKAEREMIELEPTMLLPAPSAKKIISILPRSAVCALRT